MTIHIGMTAPIVIRNRILVAKVLGYWPSHVTGRERWNVELESPRGHRLIILERSLSAGEWNRVYMQIKSFWLFLLTWPDGVIRI